MTSIKVFSETSSVFPAVSICNLNPFVTTEAIEYVKNVLKLQHFKKDSDDFAKSNNLRVYSMVTMQLIQAKAFALNDTAKKSFANLLNAFILSCTFNLESCKWSDFEWYYDQSLDNCYHFNSIAGNRSIQVKNISIPGSQGGLKMEIFLGLPEKVYQMVSTSGLRVIVHNNSVLPSSQEGIDITPGLETNIEVTRVFDYKLPKPFNNCIKENDQFDSEIYNYILKSNRTYRQR